MAATDTRELMNRRDAVRAPTGYGDAPANGVTETETEARQAVTGHNVRYVLTGGLILGLIALGIVLLLALLGVFGETGNGASVAP